MVPDPHRDRMSKIVNYVAAKLSDAGIEAKKQAKSCKGLQRKGILIFRAFKAYYYFNL
jgi:hypothetical protein